MRKLFIFILLFIGIVFSVQGQIIPGVVASSISKFPTPIASWSFEESSGSAIDAINGNNATMTSATYRQTGKVGYCFSYNGTSSYGNVGQPSILNLNPRTHPISISVWVRTNGDSGYILMKGDSDNGTRQYNIYCDGVSVGCNMAGGIWTEYTTAIADNQWHFIVITSPGNGSSGHCYIDGNLEVTTIAMGTAETNSYDILIGARRDTANTGTAGFLNGYIDQLRIYDIELSQEQVTAIYTSEN